MVTDIEVIVNSSIIVSLDVTLLIVKDHATLENLDYAHSGHTGFASSEALNNGLAAKVDKTELFLNGKVKSELIPDEFDEVMEFAKQVTGTSFMDQTLATDPGTIVWCAATKAACGETYYRKFLVNNDGTQAGVTTISPVEGKLYVGKTDSNIFRWSGSNLLEVSKSLSLGETSTTAYAGNKGKANAQAIAELQAKQLQVVGFYDSAYPSLNRLTFPTSQTQIIFFGYKYDSGDPIKGGSVPLFNDNIMELAPNSPNNEYFRVKAETSGSNTVLTIYQNLMSYVRFLVVETNVDLTGGA